MYFHLILSEIFLPTNQVHVQQWAGFEYTTVGFQKQIQKYLRFLVSTRVNLTPARQHFIYFFATKRCPITAKIAGSIGILPRCVLNDFFTETCRGMNICSIYEASGNLVWFQ